MLKQQVTILSSETIERFRSANIARGQSSNTAKAYSTDLRMLLVFHGRTTISMEEYDFLAQTWLNETRAASAPKTTGRRVTSLRSFAKWAKWETELVEYRSPKAVRSIPHPLPNRLADLERLLAVASGNEQRALVSACGFVGLRVSEALAFRPSWFNASEMTLRVRGKGDKERIVPVSPRAWESLAPAYIAAMRTNAPIISYQDRSARKAITAMGLRAGISRPVASHDLRATCATILSEMNVNPRVIQEIMGHSNLSTTEIYMGTTMSAMREAVNF